MPSNRRAYTQGSTQTKDASDALLISLVQYSRQSMCMIQETPELYERIVRPFIMAIPPSRVQWYVFESDLCKSTFHFHCMT